MCIDCNGELCNCCKKELCCIECNISCVGGCSNVVYGDCLRPCDEHGCGWWVAQGSMKRIVDTVVEFSRVTD